MGRKTSNPTMKKLIATAVLGIGLGGLTQAATTFLNVSYDPTREFIMNIIRHLGNTGNSVQDRRLTSSSLMVVALVSRRGLWFDGLQADVATMAFGE